MVIRCLYIGIFVFWLGFRLLHSILRCFLCVCVKSPVFFRFESLGCLLLWFVTCVFSFVLFCFLF